MSIVCLMLFAALLACEEVISFIILHGQLLMSVSINLKGEFGTTNSLGNAIFSLIIKDLSGN